ncbi:MAG: hypothetical protein L6R45_22270 [Anaerolineae bacterium]|nr:hypothetical protein [Anaerolineae bacterium]
MTSELSPIINTLILISAVLVPAMGWFGFYCVSIQTIFKKEHIYISTIVGLVLFGWLFVVMSLGMSDFFHAFRGHPLFPPVPNIVFGTILLIAGISLLFFSPTFRKVIDATPQHWMINIQVFRILGCIFLILSTQQILPSVFAIQAGWGDFLTGLAAPIVAYLYFSKKPWSNWMVLVWNLFGLGDLMLALTLGFLTSPGQFQRLAIDFPFTEFGQMGAFPLILIPAYLVPFFILLHIYSLRQLFKEWHSSHNEAISVAGITTI